MKNFKDLSEIAAVKVAKVETPEVTVKEVKDSKGDRFLVEIARNDVMSENEKTLVLAQCGAFKYGIPVKITTAAGKIVDAKIKLSIYISM